MLRSTSHFLTHSLETLNVTGESGMLWGVRGHRVGVTDSRKKGAEGFMQIHFISASIRQRLRFPFIGRKRAQRSFDLLQVPSLCFFKKVRKEKLNAAINWLRDLLA